MAVTVTPGMTNVVALAGEAVQVIPPNINGGLVTNPLTATDQGITTPEPIYINPISAGPLVANNTTFALAPGSTWSVIPGQSSSTWVNAASAGHKFSVIYW